MQNHSIIALTYKDDLSQQYRALSTLPGFALLESSDKQRGRYDIITAFPYERLIVDLQDAALAFHQLNNKLERRKSSLDLPFQGGAIGYLSYDLGAKIMGISALERPLLQGMPCMDMGFYDWAIISDHWKKTVCLFAANNRTETKDYIPQVLSLWDKPNQVDIRITKHRNFEPLISKEDYRQSFLAIHADLKRGRSYQVNYTQPFQSYYSGNTFDLYQGIRRQNPIPFGAFLRSASADILSFSPERFLSMHEGLLKTSPIKGTLRSAACPKRDAILREELRRSIKNRAENVMIVDLLRNDLGKIAKTGSVKVTDLCALQSYRGLHHLVSDIEAICLDSISGVEAFQACFPGGSITGAPKLEAMRIIQEQEVFGRGVYCGAVGYFSSHGSFDSNIAIRTITARQEQLHLAAGGGIVMDSLWEDEYEECFTKIRALNL